MMLLNYYERGTYATTYCNNIKFPLYVLKVLKLCLFYPPMQVDSCSHKLFAHKIPMHRKWVRLKCSRHIFHDATKNYYEGGTYACRNCNNITFPLYVLIILKLCLFCHPMLVDYCSHKLPANKILTHRKWVRLKYASHIIHDSLFMFQFLSFMWSSLKSSCLARGVKR